MPDNSGDLLQHLFGHNVVLDVDAAYVYIGKLQDADHKYLVLEDVDAHDLRDSTTTRELYVLDTKRHGVGVNRQRVYVDRSRVVGISKLSDVKE